MTQKKNVSTRFSADCEKLYGPLPEAIKYLQDIEKQYQGKNITLEEVWDGYEDMRMMFSYIRPETDEEFNIRLKQEEYSRQLEEKVKERRKQREKDFKKLKELQRKLGV